MRYLFVHQNFPGQYLHVIQHLLKDPGNEVVFISEPNQNSLAGVRRVVYQTPTRGTDMHSGVRDLDLALRRAEAVASLGRNLRGLGFTPDIIIGHHGWGELLDIGDVWPGVPLLGYFEFYYQTNGQDVGFDPEFPANEGHFPRIRSMNTINHLALALGQYGQTPTHWQFTRYPRWAQAQIEVMPEGARLDICKPEPGLFRKEFRLGDFRVGAKEKLITYVARNLEPYRGFHVMMRALPELLAARPDVKVVMVGGDDVSYGSRFAGGTWREHYQQELAGKYDTSRVLLPGQLPYADYLRLLQRSDVHCYLTYPFVASWSLREALACGCAIVASAVDPVREFIEDGVNGRLTPPLDSAALAQNVLELLKNTRLNHSLRQGARRTAERTLDMQTHLDAYCARIQAIVEASQASRPVAGASLSKEAAAESATSKKTALKKANAKESAFPRGGTKAAAKEAKARKPSAPKSTAKAARKNRPE